MIAFIGFLGMAMGYTVYQSDTEVKLSDLILENVEALARNEGNGNRDCFTKWRKAPNDDSLAFWDWICSDCESYWLVEGSIRSKC